MSLGIKNGQRVHVNFTSFKGVAGVQDRDGGLMDVAYTAKSLPRVGSLGEVDGSSVVVITAERSGLLPEMVLLLVRPE